MAQPDQMKMMRKIAQMQTDMAAAQEALAASNEARPDSARDATMIS